jgi:hypothetical protein
VAQWPDEQTSPAEQLTPHAPQLAPSVASSTQTPPQLAPLRHVSAFADNDDSVPQAASERSAAMAKRVANDGLINSFTCVLALWRRSDTIDDATGNPFCCIAVQSSARQSPYRRL